MSPGDLPRSFYERDALVVAPDLLGMVLSTGERSGRIVEVEAYRGADDPGSHGYRGLTPRTRVMFGPPGHLYVYFSYGMHWCANVVTGVDGECSAVLLRALAPVSGIDLMYRERPAARRLRHLCSGPAKLCQALGIDGALDGSDLVDGGALRIVDDGTRPGRVDVTTRIGLAVGKGETLPWRFSVAGDPNVSVRPG